MVENCFLIVANWKANKTVEEAKHWMKQLAVSGQQSAIHDNLEIAIAAPYTLLNFLKDRLATSSLPLAPMLASQDVSMFPVGAYTGEIPAKLLADLGVRYCLVGHSERRKYLHETNTEVEAKMAAAIASGITPILCAQTLSEIPENIRNFKAGSYLIMYEPSWAISTDGQYHPEPVENVVTTLTDWKNRLNLKCRFLYGGSVNAKDISDYLKPETWNLIAGIVVGHASLEAQSFFDIIDQCSKNLY